MAMQSEEGKHWGLSLFPKRAGTDKCVIHVGMPGIWIHGSCRTSVVIRSKDEATVRFVEHWNAREFFADSDHRQHLHHTWELTLSSQAPGDHVVRSRHYGDFAPQMSR